ncbi:Glycosyl transferase family 2 [Halorhabdus sp. SVX81]|nr:Glycosyl transferase family 2 [Halorhabdus sp. SVX81]
MQAQTFEPREIIIVEDASETDLETWLDREVPNATYVRHEENRGLAAARNTGFNHATGEYVAYLDDDDEWKPERLERQLKVLEGPSPDEQTKLGVIYCGVERQSPEGETLSTSLPENEGNLAASIREVGASTYPSTFLFTAEALEDVGGFDESLPSSIDHDIWMQLAVAGYEARRVMDALVVTYVSDRAQMTTNTERRIAGVQQYIEKWGPTYKEWFGEAKGKAYADRYYARVIARLAATNLVSGDVWDFWIASKSIFETSEETAYNISVLMKSVGRRMASIILPQQAKQGFRELL